MELEQFVIETVRAIANAGQKLQEELIDRAIVVNPPSDGKSGDSFDAENAEHVLRRVQYIDFDVAVTTSSEVGGEGKAGVRISVVEFSAGGSKRGAHEETSRIKFSIPISLPPSHDEWVNRGRKRHEDQRSETAWASAQASRKPKGIL